jgi:hemoglobin-like flavoprotein
VCPRLTEIRARPLSIAVACRHRMFKNSDDDCSWHGTAARTPPVDPPINQHAPRNARECRTRIKDITKPLTAETIATVKATAPALQKHGVAITTRMYERLFVDSEIKALFDEAAQESGEQPKRLAGAILAFAQNVDKLDVLKPAIERIAARHVTTNIKPEHYPAVANALLPAIKDVLGDAVDETVLAAWGEAYWFLADILIGREVRLYVSAEAEAGVIAAMERDGSEGGPPQELVAYKRD